MKTVKFCPSRTVLWIPYHELGENETHRPSGLIYLKQLYHSNYSRALMTLTLF